jgi:hypothetical protein
MDDQYDFLVEHYRQALASRGACCRPGKLGELCPSCLRFMRLRDVLMEPFRAAPAAWAKGKALAA